MGNPSKGQARPEPEEAVKCPRCESGDTKFCYYNNNSQSQPRYLCKSCRRFWTKGGTLRNVPVGGDCRKNKKSSSSSSSSPSKRIQDQTLKPNTNPIDTTNDLTLNFARLQQQYDHHDSDHLSCLGNPSLNVAGSVADPVFLGNFNGFQGLAYGFGNDTFGEVVNGVGFNGETMILYNNEDMIDSTLMTTTTITTSDVTVATMKQDGPENGSDLWDLPWQLIEDDGNNNYNNRAVGCDLDSVIDNWYGAI